MSVLREAPYSLLLGETIVARIEARNVIGFSVESVVNTGYAELRTEPLAPTTLVQRIDDGTTDSQIKARLSNEVLTGGSPILRFELWFDQGIDEWIQVTSSLIEEYTVFGLTLGQEYKFK